MLTLIPIAVAVVVVIALCACIVRKIQEKCNVYDKIKNRHSCIENTNGD